MRSENPIRAAKISYIVTSVAFCVLGILLIVLRNWSVSFIGVVTGIMLIAFGIVKLLGYFSKDLYRACSKSRQGRQRAQKPDRRENVSERRLFSGEGTRLRQCS